MDKLHPELKVDVETDGPDVSYLHYNDESDKRPTKRQDAIIYAIRIEWID